MAKDNMAAIHHPSHDIFLFQMTEVQHVEKRFNEFEIQQTMQQVLWNSQWLLNYWVHCINFQEILMEKLCKILQLQQIFSW